MNILLIKMDEEECVLEFYVKLLLVGDSGVGKTSILNRYTNNTFSNSVQSTIGVDFSFNSISVDSQTIKTQIWDLGGREIYRNIITSYYRGAHGIIIVYDIIVFIIKQNWK